MQSGNYIVYKHCSPSGKVYIGITQQKPEVRWKNGKGYAENYYFYNAIQKYGWNNFTHEILFSGLSKECACQKEIELIESYNARDPQYGYNISVGGLMPPSTEETRAATSEKMKQNWSSDEFKKRLSESMRGVKRTKKSCENIRVAQKKRFEDQAQRDAISLRQRGGKRSEVAKMKTSESLRLFYSDPANAMRHKEEMANRNKRLRKPVLCIETGEVFESVRTAADMLGLGHQNLSSCLKGRRSTFGGYHWKYAEVI